MSDEKIADQETTVRRRESRSVFGPIMLIAAGVFFLLYNLDWIPAPNWSALARLWPLALIFLGLNILAVQVRPPVGTMLSLLVTMVALAVFGYLLLAGVPDGALERFGLRPDSDILKEETFAFDAEGVSAAEITLDPGSFAVEVGALDPGGDLVAGTIWTYGDFVLQRESDAEGRVEVEVGERSGRIWFLDPRAWDQGDRTWSIGLSPDVPIDLHMDAGNGPTDAFLDGLQLTALVIDGGNGRVQAVLPEGGYDMEVDGGNGAMTLTLPESGRLALQLESGNGSVSLLLPPAMEARVVYDEGAGNITVDDRFEQISGDADEGIYETAGFDGAADRIEVELDSGNGSITITAP